MLVCTVATTKTFDILETNNVLEWKLGHVRRGEYKCLILTDEWLIMSLATAICIQWEGKQWVMKKRQQNDRYSSNEVWRCKLSHGRFLSNLSTIMQGPLVTKHSWSHTHFHCVSSPQLRNGCLMIIQIYDKVTNDLSLKLQLLHSHVIALQEIGSNLQMVRASCHHMIIFCCVFCCLPPPQKNPTHWIRWFT